MARYGETAHLLTGTSILTTTTSETRMAIPRSAIINGPDSSSEWAWPINGPAVRAGGLKPPQFRTVKVNLDATDSSSADVIVTAPSGATTTYLCGPLSASGRVQVDDRQGADSVKIQYHGRQEVLVESTPRLLPAPQSSGAGGGA